MYVYIKVDCKEKSVRKHDWFLMVFHVFKSYIATIMFLYISRRLGCLFKVTSIIGILHMSV